ncbi:unnamed protein product [Camellia sinensis]
MADAIIEVEDDDDFLAQVATLEADALSSKRRKTTATTTTTASAAVTRSSINAAAAEESAEGAYTAALRGSRSLLFQQQSSRSNGGFKVLNNNNNNNNNMFANPGFAGGGGTVGGGGVDSCFKCGKSGHWSRDCDTNLYGVVDPSVPEKACPCGLGACIVLTANTEKNRGRQFYKCPLRELSPGRCANQNNKENIYRDALAAGSKDEALAMTIWIRLLEKIRELFTNRPPNYVRVAHELHEDGEPHLHALVQFSYRFQTQDERFFDITHDRTNRHFHPNIQGANNHQAVLEYIFKYEDYTEWGEFRERGRCANQNNKENIYHDALVIGSKDEALAMVRNGDPKCYWLNYDKLLSNYDRISFKPSLPYVHRFTETVWIVPTCIQIGKTCWVRSLGPHNYYSGHIDLRDHNDDVFYNVIDDVAPQFLKHRREFIGAQWEWISNCKYARPRKIKDGILTIILCNPGADSSYRDFLDKHEHAGSKRGRSEMQSSTQSISPSLPEPIKKRHRNEKKKAQRRKIFHFQCGCLIFHTNGCVEPHPLEREDAIRGLLRHFEEPDVVQSGRHVPTWESRGLQDRMPVQLQPPASCENGGCGFFEWCDKNIGTDNTTVRSQTHVSNPSHASNPSIPELSCLCGAGSCLILTAKTGKNIGQQFYRCPANQITDTTVISAHESLGSSCGFFKWCHQHTIQGSPPVPVSTAKIYKTNETGGNNFSLRSGSSCFKCGMDGHWAKDCPTLLIQKPANQGGTTASSHACYKCGNPGHWAKDCSG